MPITQRRKRVKPNGSSGHARKRVSNKHQTRKVHTKHQDHKKHKKHHTLKSQPQHNEEVPTSPIVIGLIYANWCHHCQAMKPAWDEMKKDIMNNYNGKFSIVEIEADQPDKSEQLAKLEQMLDGQKIDAGGYPTIVKVAGGRVDYYGGNRELNDMKEWAIGQYVGGFQKEKHLHKRSKSRGRTHTPLSK
jgi:thiol-disulfide isomerase/thioredoxin